MPIAFEKVFYHSTVSSLVIRRVAQRSFAKLTQILFTLDEKLKDFTMDLKTTGNQPGMDMMPPPTFAQTGIPFNYAYVPLPSHPSSPHRHPL